MNKRSIVPLLPEPGRVTYTMVGDRRYRMIVRPCGQTCMPGHCEAYSLTHPDWSTYQITNELLGLKKHEQIRELKPLVCFHGFSESAHTWDQVYLPGYILYQIDFLGHGGSSSPENKEAYTYEALLPDIHQIIQSRIAGTYALMGYSQGARFALMYALQYGDQVSQLILESGSVGLAEEDDRQARLASDQALAQAIEEKGLEWFEGKWKEASIFDSQKSLPPEVQDRIKRRRLHNNPTGLANALRGMGQGTMPYVGDSVGQLSMPLLYVSGQLDTKYTTIGETYFSQAHTIVDGVGHNVHLEAPETFSQLVYEFLEK